MARFTPARTSTHHPALPLSRADMPDTFDISLEHYTNGRTVRIPTDFGPAQSLAGFDPDYKNIVDYIVRITHRIWETDEREVDYIAHCYSEDSLVYDDYGLQTGNKKIITDTHHTTGAFPDIILDAEEVIWAGDDQKAFHTSHLTRIIGTHTGPSHYGDATGAKINVVVIANCVARENDIFLEHVLYNTSAMLQQLGLDLWQEANRLASDPPPGWPRTTAVWDQLRAATSPDQPISVAEPVTGFDPDAFTRRVHDNIWNGDGSAIDENYTANVQFEGSTERAFNGTAAYKAYVEEIRSAFPDLALQIDEVYWMGNCEDGYLISTRWSAEGSHTGGPLYRDPTGARCQIWGITQWQVKDNQILKEWQLFNEFDLMMQIAKARRDA
ncbi:MAG: ester cyclase [Granulosicoccus sp.]|nr:ester cyclase [Granulosicoccus sp.]